MSHKLLYTKTTIKDIRRLDSVTQKRLKRKLEELSKNPLRYAKSLTDSRIGSYRLRVGNYRIIFDLDDKNIVVIRVGHRREIYRN